MINLYGIGTLQNHMKMQEAKSLWQQRKQNGYYTKMSEEDSTKASIQEQVDRMHSEAANVEVETISNKLKQGKKLTAYEMERLRQSDPVLYDKAKKIEEEKKNYEKKLKACKTKQDVERLKIHKLSSTMNAIQTVMHNPNIPAGKKLEIVEFEKMKLAAVNEAEREFIQSGELAKLPTDAEIAEARKEEQEEKKEEITKDKPKEDEIKPEEDGKPEEAPKDGKKPPLEEIQEKPWQTQEPKELPKIEKKIGDKNEEVSHSHTARAVETKGTMETRKAVSTYQKAVSLKEDKHDVRRTTRRRSKRI